MQTRARTALELIVGPGECEIATEGRVVTHRLESCVIVAAHVPRLKLAAMLRVGLPDSKMDPDLARWEPCLFADTGIPALLDRLIQHGAAKEEVLFWAIGGANVGPGALALMAASNEAAVRKNLAKAGVSLAGEDLGGSVSRLVWLESDTGRLIVSARHRKPASEAAPGKCEDVAGAASQRLFG